MRSEKRRAPHTGGYSSGVFSLYVIISRTLLARRIPEARGEEYGVIRHKSVFNGMGLGGLFWGRKGK